MRLLVERNSAIIIGSGCILILLACSLTGCGGGASGPQRGAVTGTVSFDGELVDQGSILFIPTGGTKGPSSGGGITNGKFSIPQEKGPVVGQHRVEVHWPRKTGKKREAGSPAPPGTMIEEVVEAIPAAYNSNSTLEQRVEAGENVIDIELTSKAIAARELGR